MQHRIKLAEENRLQMLELAKQRVRLAEERADCKCQN